MPLVLARARIQLTAQVLTVARVTAGRRPRAVNIAGGAQGLAQATLALTAGVTVRNTGGSPGTAYARLSAQVDGGGPPLVSQAAAFTVPPGQTVTIPLPPGLTISSAALPAGGNLTASLQLIDAATGVALAGVASGTLGTVDALPTASWPSAPGGTATFSRIQANLNGVTLNNGYLWLTPGAALPSAGTVSFLYNGPPVGGVSVQIALYARGFPGAALRLGANATLFDGQTYTLTVLPGSGGSGSFGFLDILDADFEVVINTTGQTVAQAALPWKVGVTNYPNGGVPGLSLSSIGPGTVTSQPLSPLYAGAYFYMLGYAAIPAGLQYYASFGFLDASGAIVAQWQAVSGSSTNGYSGFLGFTGQVNYGLIYSTAQIPNLSGTLTPFVTLTIPQQILQLQQNQALNVDPQVALAYQGKTLTFTGAAATLLRPARPADIAVGIAVYLQPLGDVLLTYPGNTQGAWYDETGGYAYVQAKYTYPSPSSQVLWQIGYNAWFDGTGVNASGNLFGIFLA